MKTITLKKKKHVLGTFQFLAKSLYPDITGVAIFLLILSIFWNIENTLPILLKHSKFCSFMKTITFKKKKHVLGTFQFSAKSLYPDLTGVAIFWLIFNIFYMLKIPFQFYRNIQNFDLSWKQSVWRKKSMYWGLFNFMHNRCIRTLPAWHFLVDFEYFLKYWKYPSNSSETFEILFLHENDRFEEKKACFWGLFNFWQNRFIRTLPAWHFFVDFEYFLKCWKYPSNSSETFKILFFYQSNQFQEKKACVGKISIFEEKKYFGDTSIGTKIAVSGPYQRGIFLLILSIFWHAENTLPILLKHSKFCSFMKTHGLKKKSMFWGFFNFWQNRCIRTLPAWHFLVDFEYFLK